MTWEPWLLLLSLSVVIALPVSPKFRQLFFSFQKVWSYPTSPVFWFINFKAPALIIFAKSLCYILGLELFHKKEVLFVLKASITWVGAGAIGTWKFFLRLLNFERQLFFLQEWDFEIARVLTHFARWNRFWGSYILLLLCCCMININT